MGSAMAALPPTATVQQTFDALMAEAAELPAEVSPALAETRDALKAAADAAANSAAPPQEKRTAERRAALQINSLVGQLQTEAVLEPDAGKAVKLEAKAARLRKAHALKIQGPVAEIGAYPEARTVSELEEHTPAPAPVRAQSAARRRTAASPPKDRERTMSYEQYETMDRMDRREWERKHPREAERFEDQRLRAEAERERLDAPQRGGLDEYFAREKQNELQRQAADKERAASASQEQQRQLDVARKQTEADYQAQLPAERERARSVQRRQADDREKERRAAEEQRLDSVTKRGRESVAEARSARAAEDAERFRQGGEKLSQAITQVKQSLRQEITRLLNVDSDTAVRVEQLLKNAAAKISEQELARELTPELEQEATESGLGKAPEGKYALDKQRPTAKKVRERVAKLVWDKFGPELARAVGGSVQEAQARALATHVAGDVMRLMINNLRLQRGAGATLKSTFQTAFRQLVEPVGV